MMQQSHENKYAEAPAICMAFRMSSMLQHIGEYNLSHEELEIYVMPGNTYAKEHQHGMTSKYAL